MNSIAFINMKGGVGKTTLCIGIGEYLAHHHDKKILFIDLDPQFNTTQSLLNEYNLVDEYFDTFIKEKTIRQLFKTATSIAEKPKMPSPAEIIHELDENIHVIFGTIDIIFEDNNKNATTAKRVKKFIKDNQLKEIYDYIFIDCPPTISLYTEAALYASDYYLVPNRIDRYSILGIKLLNRVIESLQYEDSDFDIKPLGIIYTMINNKLTMKTNNIKTVFEDDEIVKKIGIFTNTTTYVQDLLVGFQGNIASKYNRSREDIAAICDEFIERLK